VVNTEVDQYLLPEDPFQTYDSALYCSIDIVERSRNQHHASVENVPRKAPEVEKTLRSRYSDLQDRSTEMRSFSVEKCLKTFTKVDVTPEARNPAQKSFSYLKRGSERLPYKIRPPVELVTHRKDRKF
jgi:hypothetical protein